MNTSKKTLITTLIIFIYMGLAAFIIHPLLTGADYAKMTGVFRPTTEVNVPLIYVAYLFIAIAFVQVYLHGREDKNYVTQGLRFGGWMAILTVIPMYFIGYAMSPYPLIVIIKLISLEVTSLLIAGVITAFMLKD